MADDWTRESPPPDSEIDLTPPRPDDEGRRTEELVRPTADPSGSPPRPSPGAGEIREPAASAEPPAEDRASSREGAFQIGDVLADRYRIVRFLAAGGRGEVYEALDLELQERLAIKCIQPRLADDPRSVARFKREIHLARRITHPNVCRIFDVGVHRPQSGRPTTLFLTMELLQGEALDERLERTGRLSAEEARPIVLDLCAGLAAAHAAGVVHRDLKSDNVMLVPTKEGVRAVITDFGLARATERGTGGAFSTLTATGKVVGTPAYMAPEQIEGGEVGPWSDLYSLGIVLFEMLTGRLPFDGATPLSMAIKRLEEAAPSPRVELPDLDPLWDRIVLRCLERDPRRRYASALEVGRVLTAGEEPRGRRSRRRTLGPVAAVLLLAVASAAWWWLGDRPPTEIASATAPARERPAVVVRPLVPLGGESREWLAAVTRELLRLELLASGRFEPLAEPPARSAVAGEDPTGSGPATISGSYLLLADGDRERLRVDVRFHAGRDGESATAAVVGTIAELPLLVHELVERLAERLAVAGRIAALDDRGQPVAEIPARVSRAWGEALLLERRGRHAEAAELLRGGAAEAEREPAVWAALAELEARRGEAAAARRAMRRATQEAAAAPAILRLGWRARLAELEGDWETAIELRRSIQRIYPADLENGAALTLALAATGDREGALATLRGLREARGLASGSGLDRLEERLRRHLDRPAGPGLAEPASSAPAAPAVADAP